MGYCKAPIIWDKLNGDSLYADGEFAWTSKNLTKNLKIFRHQWCGAFKDSERGVININPCQKPIALYSWILDNYCQLGEIIIDTHFGSGSLGISCIQKDYKIIACEKSLNQCNLTKERLILAQKEKRNEFFIPDSENLLFKNKY